MKIVHISCVAPPDIGGIGRVAFKEAELLQARGIEASVVSLSTHAGFRVGNVGFIFALEHLVREADIVHLHYPFYGTQEIVWWLKSRKKIKKLVMTLHMDATAGGWKWLAANIHRAFIQDHLLKQADTLIVSSRDYAEHSSYRDMASKTIELPFGVDEDIFCPGPARRELFGLPANAQVITFVGGMDQAHAFKGVDVLLEAIARVPNVHLLLVGEGALRTQYEQHAERLGIDPRCHFVGRVEEPQLVEAYRAGDVLAFPSISGAEAFGLVAVEAQACGIPVVASALPGVRTVVAHEETGLLVPPREPASLATALSRLLEDVALRARMGQRTRERVLERFTWTRHIDELIKMYEGITDRHFHQ